MRAVVFAYHNIGCTGIEALLRADVTIAAVFTHRDDPAEQTYFRSVARLCAEHGLDVYAADDVNSDFWVARIRALAPDFLFSFYYRDLLGQTLLDVPSRGAFNLHGSLLPAYRGRAPVNWVLVQGERETGVTLHRMVARPDAGDIAAQRSIAIADDDTALSLHGKLDRLAGELLDDCLSDLLNGRLICQPQNEALACTFGRRTPADGRIDWQRPADELERLVRAVTHPYPGAFANLGDGRLTVWRARIVARHHDALPGTVQSLAPLQIVCGEDALEIATGALRDGLPISGAQLARAAGFTLGRRLDTGYSAPARAKRLTRVLILGVNGFIGNHLVERLLADGGYEIYGMDISSHTIARLLDAPNFHFIEGDISIHQEWIEYHVKKCDVILPLVAIATPIEYVRNPLRVFELDFEENLRIVRYCVKYNKRIVFPSTSEVYGMCEDALFDEETSPLIVGPIHRQRWIYSISKQLLDRVIWAYGEKEGLSFTLFRPFNWTGPRLDSLDSARVGSSRAITQLILNLVSGTPIQLIDGGEQQRCFTDIDDGIEALFRIIENRDGLCNGRIINIGNPDNEASIRELAEILVARFEAHPLRDRFPPFAGMQMREGSSYYGKGYQDVSHRRPSIRNAQRYLNWRPRVSLADTVEKTLDFFLTGTVEAENGRG